MVSPQQLYNSSNKLPIRLAYFFVKIGDTICSGHRCIACCQRSRIEEEMANLLGTKSSNMEDKEGFVEVRSKPIEM